MKSAIKIIASFMMVLAYFDAQGRHDGGMQVYKCNYSIVDISSRAIQGSEKEPKTIKLKVFYPGESCGELDVSPDVFMKIYNDSLLYDSSHDPFIMNGIGLLIKTKDGNWFKIFYEWHEDNPKEFNGMRLT